MAEDVMLKFAKSNSTPVLPIHDSFIMHYAFGESDELEEDMRRAFYGKFKMAYIAENKIISTVMLFGSPRIRHS